jgi:hypothetical protein
MVALAVSCVPVSSPLRPNDSENSRKIPKNSAQLSEKPANWAFLAILPSFGVPNNRE